MDDKMLNRYREQISRRKFMGDAGKALLVFGALVLNACSGRQSTTYFVKIQLTQDRNHFTPSALVIPVGSKVVWQNQSIYPATVTCDPGKVKSVSTNHQPATSAAYVKLPSGAAPWDSGILYPGQTWSYTFQTPGEYLYFSQYGQAPDLIGVIKVQ